MDMESALGGVGSRREGVAGWEGERECLCRVCRVQEECGGVRGHGEGVKGANGEWEGLRGGNVEWGRVGEYRVREEYC